MVEISPNAKPPVCKIVDYGKYNYEKQKKEKLAKKHQVVMQVKEIRFNPNTDTHDLDFKAKHLRHFLMEGHKVKVTVIFRGRMITHSEFGEKLMQDVISKLDDIGKIEAPPKMEGKQLIVYMTPDRNKIKTLKEKNPKTKESKEAEESTENDSEEINKE